MKKLNVFNIVLGVAVIILFVLFFDLKNKNEATDQKQINKNDTINNVDLTKQFKIAYINIDTLLLSYKLAKKLESILMEKQKKMEADLNKKSLELQKEAANFQKKLQTNSFLSLESAKAQEQELYEKQQKLLQLRDQMTQEILIEQQNLNKQLLDSVINFLKEFNKKAGYSYILNSNAFLIGDTASDITSIVVRELNLRYEKSKTDHK